MTLLEKLGFVMWVCSYLFESIADHQKLQFIIEKVKKEGDRTAVCNVGLWQYSRHPNYFGEWMVWVSLSLASLPSLRQYLEERPPDAGEESRLLKSKVAAALGLLGVPLSMY